MSAHRYKELIGRAAALVLALLLLWGAYGLGTAASWANAEERKEDQRTQSVSRSKFQRKTRIGWFLWLSSGALCIAGLGGVAIAVLPASVMHRIRPKPATLWENPEPGQINRF